MEDQLSSLFFSYSHADEGLRDQLEKHLSALKHQGLIETWHDRRIVAGQEFADEIDAHLEAADIVLLLVSSDFLASDYCYRREMQKAMERHERREAQVIPVILRPCDWHDLPFGKLQATPKNGWAITKWPNADEAFLDVVTAIKRALKQGGGVPRAAVGVAAQNQPISRPAPTVRSSNLRVAKQFNDFDKDSYLREAFDYIAKFFENSVAELEARNPGLNGSFRRIDANRFAAAVYRGGRKECRCSIYLGGMFGGIAYSADENAGSQSFNESLSAKADDQTLYLEPLGMQSYGQKPEKLGFEGAAEFLWQIFIAPLQ